MTRTYPFYQEQASFIQVHFICLYLSINFENFCFSHLGIGAVLS